MLVLRSANGNAVGVSDNNNGSQLFAENTGVVANGCGTGQSSLSGMCIGDILVVSDCQKARVFQATNLTATGGGNSGNAIDVVHSSGGGVNAAPPGNAIPSWGGNSNSEETFGPDSEIIRVGTTLYYIRTSATSGRPSLYQRIGNQDLELLEGVENMQLTYGRDTTNDGIPDVYNTATEVTTASGWDSVASVRVQLLVASIDDNVLQESQPYTFPSTAAAATTPADRRLRQIFINTIGIRSRLP
jgi:type IV pilus assembly protein PilW